MNALAQTVLVRVPSALHEPVRLFHGAAVERPEWEALSLLERRRLFVRARYGSLESECVVSGTSAAALWGLPDFDAADWRLHVIDVRLDKTHTGRGVVRHTGRIRNGERVVVDGIPTTSLERTVLDIARRQSFTHAVVVLHHVLRFDMLRREGLTGAFDALGRVRGCRQAAAAIAFALAESPGESISRVTAHLLGIPAPELQHEFETPRGRFRTDFWWPDAGVIGEFDGRLKYDVPRALWDEKTREDTLRRLPEVHGFARWTMREAADARAPAAVLSAAGLPLFRAAPISARRQPDS
ncbi:hypothetical protein DEJ30_06325 [Curtobacterium sp. MCPF17_003]|nr:MULTISPECIES: hypothetical protein [unclassified Curtobacterium]PYY64932.1 hypothetical protein DEJ30_06325 [Curtobacterium sp. MCPF17_003]PZE67976.1 hypothetical protein DEJ27_11190 [Curtobacterium sp. MCPF17_018]PZF34475.1 hypothetical protein DEJ35_01180 [Curtobacterium sp. MCPF17_051]